MKDRWRTLYIDSVREVKDRSQTEEWIEVELESSDLTFDLPFKE